MTLIMKLQMAEVMIVMTSSLVCFNFHFLSKFTEKAYSLYREMDPPSPIFPQPAHFVLFVNRLSDEL